MKKLIWKIVNVIRTDRLLIFSFEILRLCCVSLSKLVRDRNSWDKTSSRFCDSAKFRLSSTTWARERETIIHHPFIVDMFTWQIHTWSASVEFSWTNCSFLSVNLLSSVSHFESDLDVESIVLRSVANCNDKWLSFSWPLFISLTNFVISMVNLEKKLNLFFHWKEILLNTCQRLFKYLEFSLCSLHICSVFSFSSSFNCVLIAATSFSFEFIRCNSSFCFSKRSAYSSFCCFTPFN